MRWCWSIRCRRRRGQRSCRRATGPTSCRGSATRGCASTRRALPDADDATALFAFRHWRDESGAVLREAQAGIEVAAPRCPVLCIASAQDEDVPPALTAALADAWDADAAARRVAQPRRAAAGTRCCRRSRRRSRPGCRRRETERVAQSRNVRIQPAIAARGPDDRVHAIPASGATMNRLLATSLRWLAASRRVRFGARPIPAASMASRYGRQQSTTRAWSASIRSFDGLRHHVRVQQQRCYERPTYVSGDDDGYDDGYYRARRLLRPVRQLPPRRSAAPRPVAPMATVVGAIVGAAIGSQVGGGSARYATSAIGSMVGGMAGRQIYEQSQRQRTGMVRVCDPVYEGDGYPRRRCYGSATATRERRAGLRRDLRIRRPHLHHPHELPPRRPHPRPRRRPAGVGSERGQGAGGPFVLRSVVGHGQSIVPRTTLHTWPPDQTSPSASTCRCRRASRPTSRPWLTR